MGYNEIGALNGTCTYARIKYDERADRKRSSSEPREHTSAKLHKPPTIPSLHKPPPRNRLQKRSATSPAQTFVPPPTLLVLSYESYPYNTSPGVFLGVYSTVNSVTKGAFHHGAYTFSREGLVDGSEYLSATGRISIMAYVVQRVGLVANDPETTSMSSNQDGGRESGVVRLDIPHPESRGDLVKEEESGREKVFLAVHEGPQEATCLGLFATKGSAWGACLKDKAWLAVTDTLTEEERSIDEDDMPRATARLVGSGKHAWFVTAREIDSPG